MHTRRRDRITEGKLKEEGKANDSSGCALERDGSDDYLMVQCSECSSDEGSNPENPLRIRNRNKDINTRLNKGSEGRFFLSRPHLINRKVAQGIRDYLSNYLTTAIS